MKKRMIMLGLSLSLSLMTLAGCGFGGSHKTEAAAESEVSTYNEPTEEILSADFTDFKFQVDDVVFQTKTQMTVEEFIGQFPEGEYVVAQYNTKDGSFSDQPLDRLIKIDGLEGYYIQNKKYDNSYCVHITAENKSDSVCELKDCTVTSIELNKFYSGTIYFAKGIPYYNDPSIHSDERFSYENIVDTFAGYGLETMDEITYMFSDSDETQFAGRQLLVTGSDGLSFQIIAYGDMYKDNLIRPARYTLFFTIDPDTRMLKSFSVIYAGALEPYF